MARPVHRRSVRIPDHHYNSGSFLVTVCSAGRRHIFGRIEDGTVLLSGLGTLVQHAWNSALAAATHVDSEAFVIMPNHVHFVVTLESRREPQSRHANGGLADFVRGFKARATGAAGRSGPPQPIWQRGFHERVLGTDRQVAEAVSYVVANPDEWPRDPYRRPTP